jgi:hypothetical protein
LFSDIACLLNYAWLIRDSEAGNIRKQLWLRIPKGIIRDEKRYQMIVFDK